MNNIVETNTRMDWLDTVKAIGMILVYIGHCNIPGWNKYIYLFHMPLFFFISGYLWNKEKNQKLDSSTFIKKKIKAYIIPYFKIATICFIIYGIFINFFRLGGFTTDFFQQLFKYIYGIFIYSRGTVEWLPQCSPIWFLTCLFCAEIIYYFIMRMKYPIIGVIFSCFIGFIFSKCIKAPWNIDNAFSAIFFLYIGMQVRQYWKTLTNWKIILPLLVISGIIIYTNETLVDFDGNRYSNMLMMYIKSTIISLSVLTFVYKWGGVKWLSFFGKETIVLFGYNYLINIVAFKLCNSNVYFALIVAIMLGATLVLTVSKFEKIKKIIR